MYAMMSRHHGWGRGRTPYRDGRRLTPPSPPSASTTRPNPDMERGSAPSNSPSQPASLTTGSSSNTMGSPAICPTHRCTPWLAARFRKGMLRCGRVRWVAYDARNADAGETGLERTDLAAIPIPKTAPTLHRPPAKV
jgi:hypothetical protein